MKKIAPFLFAGLAILGLVLILTGCEDGGNDSALNPQTGSGGSMARFAITGNTLYIVTKQSLEVYDIENGANPVKAVKKDMGVGIETIFPYRDNLYIGAMDGMYIFNNTDPRNPVLESKFQHIQSCDPVVVQGKYAYVTLRSGVTCRVQNSVSSLDVVDVSDPAAPKMVHTQRMTSPYGLGVSGNRLFVCEGSVGLTVLDITDPTKPVFKETMGDLPAYDIIVRNKHMIVTGGKGLFQYKHDNADNIEFLSKIPVL
ncbi:LVIVD repeat-containing protein [Dyadobacter sp. CY351]|uniref:LVIVD repeat-containing protein n=1 Tax=Dyadobacter sp. CY351 TaxID=2909337 RepID=UPI001F31222A|nr:hypothetical protein [Dyadobacter sp. CY351]MCF2518612.1 hypothetical protein [Dyadobacter sp. CY351]